MDVLIRILRFKKQQLRHNQVGHVIFDRADHKHHSLLQQTRVDVKGTLAPSCGLNDHGHQTKILCRREFRILKFTCHILSLIIQIILRHYYRLLVLL